MDRERSRDCIPVISSKDIGLVKARSGTCSAPGDMTSQRLAWLLHRVTLMMMQCRQHTVLSCH